jgi:hypothetical protein
VPVVPSLLLSGRTARVVGTHHIFTGTGKGQNTSILKHPDLVGGCCLHALDYRSSAHVQTMLPLVAIPLPNAVSAMPKAGVEGVFLAEAFRSVTFNVLIDLEAPGAGSGLLSC